ncbi:MAG: radical SAM protein [Clostridia bacterium]|nr:radical SAM protein [Clostridia bacterium]
MECRLCPRNCGIDREKAKGYCGCGNKPRVAHAMLHHWEEPCISGKNGSGCVFFAGCQLKCVYCQNRAISRAEVGKEYSEAALAGLFLDLQRQGAHNINLVTPDHFALKIRSALLKAKEKGLAIPVVYNCSGYVFPQTLKSISDCVDIYLTDFKYMSPLLAQKYSSCRDYPERAKDALEEMLKEKPRCVFDENGMMKSGVIVRHLILPGCTADSKAVLDYLHSVCGDRAIISIMNQFTPIGLEKYPELNRRLTTLEYDRVVEYALSIGITNAYIQEKGTAEESFIPPFET